MAALPETAAQIVSELRFVSPSPAQHVQGAGEVVKWYGYYQPGPNWSPSPELLLLTDTREWPVTNGYYQYIFSAPGGGLFTLELDGLYMTEFVLYSYCAQYLGTPRIYGYLVEALPGGGYASTTPFILDPKNAVFYDIEEGYVGFTTSRGESYIMDADAGINIVSSFVGPTGPTGPTMGGPTAGPSGATWGLTLGLSANSAPMGITAYWTAVSGPSGGTVTFGNTADPAGPLFLISTGPSGAPSWGVPGEYTIQWNWDTGIFIQTNQTQVSLWGQTAWAGYDQTVAGLTGGITGTPPPPGHTGAWSTSLLPGGVTVGFGNTLDPATTFYGSTYASNIVLQWAWFGPTYASSDNVVMGFTAATPYAGPDDTIWSTGYTLQGNTPPLGVTATWTVAGPGPGNGGVGPMPLQPVVGLLNIGSSGMPNAVITLDGSTGPGGPTSINTPGIYTLEWSWNDGVTTTSDLVAITLWGSTAFAGHDFTFNTPGASSRKLAGNPPPPGHTGAWAVMMAPMGGGATFADSSTYNTDLLTNGVTGTYNLVWNWYGATATSSDTVNITFV